MHCACVRARARVCTCVCVCVVQERDNAVKLVLTPGHDRQLPDTLRAAMGMKHAHFLTDAEVSKRALQVLRLLHPDFGLNLPLKGTKKYERSTPRRGRDTSQTPFERRDAVALGLTPKPARRSRTLCLPLRERSTHLCVLDAVEAAFKRLSTLRDATTKTASSGGGKCRS